MSETTAGTFDQQELENIRADFPILSSVVNGKPLVYLDNGASAQKPLQVIEAISEYYKHTHSNVHRGIHHLSDKATRAYEGVREKVRRFMGGLDDDWSVIFTKGTTDGINLVASSFAEGVLKPGDEVLISAMEHHSNIVPWQMACARSGATLRAVPVTDRGELDMEAFHALLSPRTRIVALVHVSNSLGTVNPVQEITEAAHKVGAAVLLDGAQATPHMKVDLPTISADFYVWSAHKAFGPTGTGVLAARSEWLDRLPPYQGGGDMIDRVTLEKTTYNGLPYKFEAGTPNIAGVVGMGAALDYLEQVGWDRIAAQEAALLKAAEAALLDVPGLRIIGKATHKASVISFITDWAHPSDLGTLLDAEGVAIRTGHHCTQPLMDRFAIPGTARASFAFYNRIEETETLKEALMKAYSIFA